MSRNVLVTAGSRRVPLVQAFQRALRAAGGGRVIVSDVNPLSPAVYVADRSYGVPLSTDPAYFDAIADLCAKERIALVVPTIDDELLGFAERASDFAREGVQVAVSPAETVAICNDKARTCRTLRARGINAANTYLPDDLPADPSLPMFVKPRWGRGGVGAFPARDAGELEFFLRYVDHAVVQDFLSGPEFTIDMLCDQSGEPLAVVPRERVVVRAGVVDRGRTVCDPALIGLGLACARSLRFFGAINIQCRVTAEGPTVFEINPRFSGGIPLTIASGADFPRMLVDLVRGVPVSPAIGRFQDDLWMTNYESSIFVRGNEIAFHAAPPARSIPEVA